MTQKHVFVVLIPFQEKVQNYEIKDRIMRKKVKVRTLEICALL